MKATRLPNPHFEQMRTQEGLPRDFMQRLYHLEPPLPWHKWGDQDEPREELRWIVVSDALTMDRGPESMAFRSDDKGGILDFEDLESHHPYNHVQVLKDLGVTEIVDEIGD